MAHPSALPRLNFETLPLAINPKIRSGRGTRTNHLSILLLSVISATGCMSPYRADRGAALGGLGGAGVGALVGNAVGHTGAGAVIGAGVGALSGAAVGGELDSIEAENRAMIDARTRRPVATGGVTLEDVIAMSNEGVEEDLIVNHIRANGVAARLRPGDLIWLQKQNVPRSVIGALQSSGPPRLAEIAAPPPPVIPPPVIIEENYYDYGPPVWAHHHHFRPPPPRFGFGFSYRDDPCW